MDCSGYGGAVRFRVLGPLRVAEEPIRASQQRVVLAVLLAEAGRPVGADRLVDEVWGERPPRSAQVTLQGYVARLRKTLGSGALVTRGRGYELVVADDEVDATVFGRLLADGRESHAAGDLEEARRRLSQGLELWRGPALADVPASPTVTPYQQRLERLRLDAQEARLGVLLELGRYAELIGEADGLVAAHPLRERLWAHLMLALYRSGRRAEALAAYQQARRLLADELGLEPGAELRQLQQAMLADDARLTSTTPAEIRPAAVVPAQLPADVAGFTGREEYLKQLDTLLRDPDDPQPVLVISALTGAAGVGKTALAVHWAQRVRDRFPDGQLYVNLRGYAAGPPVRPVDALAGFLGALGVPAEKVPEQPEPAAALYRSLLADKRMLVLVDNARTAEQIRPLLPGSARCLVLVTSRDRLGGLVARDGATRVDLESLTPDEAQALLIRLLGMERTRAEPDAVTQIARLCDRLPLALRIAAANLAARPGLSIADYAAELAGGDRLDALEVEGDPQAGVRVAFDFSYLGLAEPDRRLFRLLGLVPGPDVTPAAAAALAGVRADHAARGLDRLAAAHLVEEAGPDRYSMHDLLRRYASQRVATEVGRVDGRAALHRLYQHYLQATDAAARLLFPQAVRLPGPEPAAGPAFPDNETAMEWLEVERPNLVAAVRDAAEHGPYGLASRLTDALRGHLYHRMYTVDLQVVADAALAAADAGDDPSLQAAARLAQGQVHLARNRYQAATVAYREAVDRARLAGWDQGQSGALGNLGSIYGMTGRLVEAVDCYTRALTVDRRIGWLAGQMTKLNNLAIVYEEMGRLAEAADAYLEALELYRRISPGAELLVLDSLGRVYHALGRTDEARDLLARALAGQREGRDRNAEGYTLGALACLRRDLGDLAEAGRLTDAAAVLAGEIGDERLATYALLIRSSLGVYSGRFSQAIDGYSRALEQTRAQDLRAEEAQARSGLAAAYHGAGNVETALAHARAALDDARHKGMRVVEAGSLTILGAAELLSGHPDHALDHAEQALAIHHETGDVLGCARAHLVAAAALRRLGRDGPASGHRDRAHALAAGMGAPIDPHARQLRIADLLD
jgi:DNA-binding SARP family transcriptional activator/Tfp pilus assembly protein PilF